MVLAKLPVPGRHTNLDYSRGKGLLRLRKVRVELFMDIFLSSIIPLFFLPLADNTDFNVLGAKAAMSCGHVVENVHQHCIPKECCSERAKCCMPPEWFSKKNCIVLLLLTKTRTDARCPVLRSWIRSAEVRGRHHYETEMMDDLQFYVLFNSISVISER